MSRPLRASAAGRSLLGPRTSSQVDDAEHDERSPHHHQEYGDRRIRTPTRWRGKSRSAQRTEDDHGRDPNHPPDEEKAAQPDSDWATARSR